MSEPSSKNFSAKELRCRCAKCLQNVPNEMNPWAVMLFQRIRTEYGKPLVLSSAYRCPEHPDEAKKAKVGRHNMGVAFDVRVPWGTDRMELFRIALRHGARRFGVANGFLHIDFDTTGATCWGYS